MGYFYMGSVQESSSKSVESSLTRTQGKILEARENVFQSWYLPQAKQMMTEFDPTSASGSANMTKTAGGINRSFDSAQKQTNQALAQQNLLGTGAGAALTAANNRARCSALADAYATQMSNSTSQKANFLSNMATLMPSTTQAAPTLSSSSSSGVSIG
jgi:hypothetical protein